MKKRYYIEISESVDKQSYIMQSDRFDIKQEAIKWANKIVWLDNSFEAYLMSSEFIEVGRELKIRTISDGYTKGNYVAYFYPSYLGKTLFTSKEEAEAKLKELKEQKNE